MNLYDDPEFAALQRLHRVRGSLIRSAIIWTPLFVVAGLGFIFYTVDTATGGTYGGTWVLVVILGIAAFLFGFQSIQALLDVFGASVEEDGIVQRRWARRDSFVIQTQYLRLDNRILRGDAHILADIHEGDRVHASYFPHSNVLITIEKLPPHEDAKPDNPSK